MDIHKIQVRRRGSDVQFEVTCVHGTNYIVYRKVFDSYRRASKYVRDALKSARGQSERRYEIREVHRMDVMYARPTGKPRPARRLVETMYTKGWDMVKRPSKKGGILI